MKIASYNVENLFQRARVLNQDSREVSRAVLKMHADLNHILSKPQYSKTDKDRIVELMERLGIDKADDGGRFAILRQNRGKLVKRGRNGLEVVAGGRGEWIGWLDLKYEAVDEIATRMTAKVIDEVDADVVGLVEAESRPSLLRFRDDVMEKANGAASNGRSYEHVMLIDGNDDRGIDVAIMTRLGFAIERICSHVDDTEDGRRIFSRDCAEYHLHTPSGERLIVLVNHFKSKGFGAQSDSDRKREAQARRVKAIYDKLRHDGARHVAVLGDLNDTPDSAPLKPLLESTDLKDIAAHADFDDDGRPGTFGNGTASNKIDYILLSPELFQRVRRGQIFRMGVWGGKNGTLFPHFDEITKAGEAASDHAAIWAEIEL
jgi:endonuclease/exonuclease/phosphatase family metal-dependent hydrolase